jgi:hypothetical protein
MAREVVNTFLKKIHLIKGLSRIAGRGAFAHGPLRARMRVHFHSFSMVNHAS